MKMSGKWGLLLDMCQCWPSTNVEEIEVDFENDINEGHYDSDDDDF